MARPLSLPALLRVERDYRLYWSGQLMASTGYWLVQSVLAYVVAVRFVSPSASGLVAFCSLAPVVLVALQGGALADRVSRRLVLRAAAAAQAVVALGFAALVATGSPSLVALCVLSAATGLAMGLAVPSSQSFVVDLVPRAALPTAVAAGSVQFNAARAVGPWLGGVLIAAQRVSTAFVVAAAAYAVQACNLHRLRIAAVPAADRGRVSALAGVRHALASPPLRRLLLCSALVQFLGTPIITFLALYSEQVLDIGGLGYAGLLSAFGAGAVLAGLSTAHVSARLGRPRTYALCSGAFGLALLGFSTAQHVVLAGGLLVLCGMGFVGSSSALMTAQQLTVAPAMRGRVAAVSFLVSMGALPLGTVVQGVAAEQVGLPAVTGAAGALLAGQALLAWVATSSRPVGVVLGVDERGVPPLLPEARAATGCTLVVDLRPGVAALQGVLAVLHARAASIAGLAYTVHADVARMEIRLLGPPEQTRRLAAQVDRRVDVLTTRLAPHPVHVDDEPAPPRSSPGFVAPH